jgi:hypothetical protein
MQHSDAPWKELTRAESELGAMKTATDMRIRLEHWLDFMRAIERVWNKAEGHFSRSPKWQPWRGRYVRLRKQDPLLIYLAQARNVEEHSSEPSAVAVPGGFSIGRGAKSVYIEKLRIDGSGRVAEYRGSHPIEIQHPTVAPAGIDNRGVRYEPPTSHLGNPVQAEVIPMAELGLAFYRDFLNAAETEFVGSK